MTPAPDIRTPVQAIDGLSGLAHASYADAIECGSHHDADFYLATRMDKPLDGLRAVPFTDINSALIFCSKRSFAGDRFQIIAYNTVQNSAWMLDAADLARDAVPFLARKFTDGDDCLIKVPNQPKDYNVNYDNLHECDAGHVDQHPAAYGHFEAGTGRHGGFGR